MRYDSERNWGERGDCKEFGIFEVQYCNVSPRFDPLFQPFPHFTPSSLLPSPTLSLTSWSHHPCNLELLSAATRLISLLRLRTTRIMLVTSINQSDPKEDQKDSGRIRAVPLSSTFSSKAGNVARAARDSTRDAPKPSPETPETASDGDLSIASLIRPSFRFPTAAPGIEGGSRTGCLGILWLRLMQVRGSGKGARVKGCSGLPVECRTSKRIHGQTCP